MAQRSRGRATVAGAARPARCFDAAGARDPLRLLDELERWNASYNPTAIRDRRLMLTHHLLDSPAARRVAGRIADVGNAPFKAAAGVIDPARQFTLLDSQRQEDPPDPRDARVRAAQRRRCMRAPSAFSTQPFRHGPARAAALGDPG